jgi:hypothetical protein
MDLNFLPTITAAMSTTNLTPEMLKVIETYFEMEALDPMGLEAIAPALKVIYDWLEPLYRVGILTLKHQQLTKDLEEKQRELKQFVKEMNLEKASIEQVELSLDKGKVSPSSKPP